MRSFLYSLFGSLTALIILGLGAFVGFLLLIGFVVSTNSKAMVKVEAGSVLVFDLNTAIQDTPPLAELDVAVQEVLGNGIQKTTYLLKVLDAIESSETDENISAIFLHGSLITNNYGSGLAAVSEIRKALESFKSSGKKVYAYIEDPSQKDYYLTSIANEIWLNPFGMVSLNGLATNGPFLGGTLEKYGIGVQTTKVGDYKSAVEVFTRTSMSDADREQRTALLSDLWIELLEEISAARKIEPKDLLRISNEDAFFTAAKAIEAKLADRVGYFDELIDYLSEKYPSTNLENSFQQIDLIDYAKIKGFESYSFTQNDERIAIVYAEGEIVDGGYAPNYIGSDWLAYELRHLRQDKAVKAVVLRVNSPGGSAVASEVMQRETRLLAAEKPLIVSMGSYAASGGYWISAYADKIYAQPYTITGSIGVFGLVFNIKDAAEKFAVHFDGVKTSPFADIYSMSRARTTEEMALIQGFTDEIYEAFISKVAEGRSLKIDTVREIAQGRVWSGSSAWSLDLVDEIGGLNDAINEAFELSGLNSFSIEQVPAPSSLADRIALFIDGTNAAPVTKAHSPIQKIALEMNLWIHQLRGLNDPKGIYARMPYGLESL